MIYAQGQGCYFYYIRCNFYEFLLPTSISASLSRFDLMLFLCARACVCVCAAIAYRGFPNKASM